MTGVVAVLPEALANQIAAGEVVERPASVVKELLENSLDAGATTIFVDVMDAGRKLVRVVDDGVGMSPSDARLAVERHATSKVRTSADLSAIGTLGFRGEALPSIASVSRFRLVTRTEDDIAGTEVTIEGGGTPLVKDAGGPVGTRIEVADLFHNVPARLKFLKRAPTEMGHINGLVTAAALGYPHVHFRLIGDGRVRVDHPVAPSLRQRIFQVLGAKTTERLYEVRGQDVHGAGSVRIRGFVSEPTYHRTNQRGIHTFINGRWVRDKVVNHAVVSAYGNLLDRGRYPHAVLYLHVPPDEMDVNVHPAKAEVRFVRPGNVHDAIVTAVRTTLATTPWAGSSPSPLGPSPFPASYGATDARRTALPMDVWGLAHGRRGAAGSAAPTPSMASPERELDFSAPQPDGSPSKPAFFSRMRVIGQAGRTYLVCENHTGVHVIDQHAAHERVGYERIKSGYCDAKLARQQLLLPIQIELSAAEGSAVSDHLPVLDRLGFDIEHFGGPTWQVTAIPALLARADVGRLVRDVIAELTDVGRASLAQAELDLLFSTMACHSVVRAGDTLNNEEIRALLEMMDEVDLGANCPHGRPVLLTMPFEELARRFHRT